MNITSLMSGMCLTMAIGTVLVSSLAGEDRGQVHESPLLRFDKPLTVHGGNSGYSVARGVEEIKAPFAGSAVLYLTASMAESEPYRQAIRHVTKPSAVFPEEAWADASPETQGVDPVKLKAAVDYLGHELKDYGAAGTLFIVRNGYAIWAGPGCDRQYQIYSATKSFTSTVLGLLIDDGKVTLGTLAKDVEPALAEQYPTCASAWAAI